MKKTLVFILCLTVCLAALVLSSCGGCKHEFDEGIVIEHATCEQSGRRLLTCKLCGGSKYETIEPEHYYVNGEVITPVGCLTDGERKTVCVVCGAESTAPIPCPGSHTWDDGALKDGAAGCGGTAKAVFTCKKCHATEERNVSISGGIHVYLLDHYIEEPSCCEPGEAVYRCANCGTTKTDVAPPTEQHIASSVMKSDETGHWLACRTPGCPARDEYVSHHYIDDLSVTPVPTDGCKPGAKGVVCTICDYHTMVAVESVNPHTYTVGAISSDATTVTYTCQKCGISKEYSLSYIYTFEDRKDFKLCDQTMSELSASTSIRYEGGESDGNHYRVVTQTASPASFTQFQTNGSAMLRTTEKVGFVEFKIRAVGMPANSTLNLTLFNASCSDWGDGYNGSRGCKLLSISGTTIAAFGKSTGLFANNMNIGTISESEFTTIRVEYETAPGYLHFVYYINGTPVMETVNQYSRLGDGSGDLTSIYLDGNVRTAGTGYAFDDFLIGYQESGIPVEG